MNRDLIACVLVPVLAGAIIFVVGYFLIADAHRRKQVAMLNRAAGIRACLELLDGVITEHGEAARIDGPVRDALTVARNDIYSLLISPAGKSSVAFFDAVVGIVVPINDSLDPVHLNPAPSLGDLRRQITNAEALR